MWNIESKWVKNQRYYVNVHQRHWAVRNTNFQVFANLKPISHTPCNIHPFASNAPFLYSLKTLKNHMTF